MVTTNPGDALSRCWKKTVGRLTPDAFADIVVLRSRGKEPVWTQVVESTEDDVMLVVQGGIARYGDASLMTKAGVTPSSPIKVSGRNRRFAIPDPDDPNRAWTLKAITDRLNAVRADPVKALQRADGVRRAFAGSMDAPDAPLELVLDMPTGGSAFAGNIRDNAAQIVIPPTTSLVHDKTFFKAIKDRGFHGGILDKLAGFYP